MRPCKRRGQHGPFPVAPSGVRPAGADNNDVVGYSNDTLLNGVTTAFMRGAVVPSRVDQIPAVARGSVLRQERAERFCRQTA